MIIKSMYISGLFNKARDIYYDFNSDLNIITGRNGSGKTTVMKLAWLILSGNISYALKEIQFKSCSIVTSEYTFSITKISPVNSRITLEVHGEILEFEDDQYEEDEDPFFESAADKIKSFISEIGSSIFFPTFRRIEGGFSLSSSSPRARLSGRSTSDVDEALTFLSRKLTNSEHLFISAISTQDINELLLRRYASFSEEINAYQQEVSRNVIDRIKHYESAQNSQSDAESLLYETRVEIEKIEHFRSNTMRPLDAVRELIEKLFQHSGISFGSRLNFGDAAASINSHLLSAGEKQMLSFICYNAFYKNSVIFIDEPELSLHVEVAKAIIPDTTISEIIKSIYIFNPFTIYICKIS